MSLWRLAGLAVSGAAMLAGAGCGDAPDAVRAGWSTPADLGTAYDLQADIASDGTSAIAWQPAPSGEVAKRRLMLTTGDGRGRFDKPRTLVRTRSDQWDVAAAPGGAFLVAWQGPDGLYAAVRAKGTARVDIRRVASGDRRRRGRVEAAADPRGGWVIAEVQERTGKLAIPSVTQRVRVLSLDARGRPASAPRDLGYGSFGRRGQSTSLAIDATGRAVLAFSSEPSPAAFREQQYGGRAFSPSLMFTTRPHGGSFATPRAIPVGPNGSLDDAQVAIGPDGQALVSATRIERCGEAGCFGAPALSLLSRDGRPGKPFGPSLRNPGRAFTPGAVFTRPGQGVVTFLMKTRPAGFSTAAPVRAATFGPGGRIGSLQTLAKSSNTLPYIASVSGARTLVVWSDAGRRFGAALAGPDGRFQRTAAPIGTPPEELCCPARTLASSGRWVLQAWTDNRYRGRASVRRF